MEDITIMDILHAIAPILLTPALAGCLLVYKYFSLSKEEYDIYKNNIVKTLREFKYEFTNNEDIEQQRRNHELEMNKYTSWFGK